MSAGFPLDSERDDEELKFRRAEPVGCFLKRCVHRSADLDALGNEFEFLAHGTGNFTGDDAQRFGNREARSQTTHKQLQCVGKIHGEPGDTLVDQKSDNLVRQAKANEEAKEYCQQRSEEHTSEIQSLMRISYAVF